MPRRVPLSSLAAAAALAACAAPAPPAPPAATPPIVAAEPPLAQAEVILTAQAPLSVPEPEPKPEGEAAFYAFLQSFRAEAIAAGVQPATYDRAMSGLTINPRVQELNTAQPEFVRPIWDYLAGAVSDLRVRQGQEALAANEAVFDRLESADGVPRQVVAAIWGLETGFGRNKGNLNLFQSLATLAFEGRRQDFAKRELIAALKISESEGIDPKAMNGSWAGAFGHTQFIPTTFLRHAVDGDGDGKRDLWNSSADALASAASYLKDSGWKAGERWGEEVRLPDSFPYEIADPDIRRSESEWARLGVRTGTGQPLRGSDDQVAIFLPAGARGPAFIVRDNFHAILKYNNATAYALAIGLLSDRFRGREGVVAPWPRDEKPLDRDQRVALQEGLTALGFNTGNADGVLGRATRAALRNYQISRKLPADGFATVTVLERIAAERASLNQPQ